MRYFQLKKDMMTWKELTDLLEYDVKTGLFTWKVRACRNRFAGQKAGTTRKNGYVEITIDRKCYQAHRLAWFYVHKKWPDNQIDHINHNPTDNRIDNLRDATNLENGRNQKLNIRNTSGHAGVHWNTKDKRWIASIKVHGTRKYLGCFTQKEEAVQVRREAEIAHNFHPNHAKNEVLSS